MQFQVIYFSLYHETCKMLLLAFIICHLDHNNMLLPGLTMSLLSVFISSVLCLLHNSHCHFYLITFLWSDWILNSHFIYWFLNCKTPGFPSDLLLPFYATLFMLISYQSSYVTTTLHSFKLFLSCTRVVTTFHWHLFASHL